MIVATVTPSAPLPKGPIGARTRRELRPDWDTWFLQAAALAATRSGCTRRAVGAVLVGPDQRKLGEGYNGTTTPGAVECMDGGCPRGATDVPPGSSYDTGPGACTYVHAEQNALMDIPGQVPPGSRLYLVCLKPVAWPGDTAAAFTLHPDQGPCDGCARYLTRRGVDKVIVPAVPSLPPQPHGE